MSEGQQRPRLRLIHGEAPSASQAWHTGRTKPVSYILDSFQNRANLDYSALAVRRDGTVLNGNTRLFVLRERGYDIDTLDWTPMVGGGRTEVEVMPERNVLDVLSSRDAMLSVAELAERMTIVARSAYRGVDEPDVARLQAANETLHAITAKLVGLSRGTNRFPDEEFLHSIRERAGPILEADLDWAITDVLQAVNRSAARS